MLSGFFYTKVTEMKDITNMKNYREKYKRYYNIEFGREYEIHHIDLNHENNDIENLVLLPKKLHHRYHFYINALQPMQTEKYKITFDIRITGNYLNEITYERTMMNGLIDALEECNKWFDFRERLRFRKVNDLNFNEKLYIKGE